MAERQGQTAALNMMGERTPFRAVPFFWSQHYDVPINYVGHAEKWDAIEIDGDVDEARLRRALQAGRQASLAVASIYRDTCDSLEGRGREMETITSAAERLG